MKILPRFFIQYPMKNQILKSCDNSCSIFLSLPGLTGNCPTNSHCFHLQFFKSCAISIIWWITVLKIRNEGPFKYKSTGLILF
jgi:hypothetical protein